MRDDVPTQGIESAHALVPAGAGRSRPHQKMGHARLDVPSCAGSITGAFPDTEGTIAIVDEERRAWGGDEASPEDTRGAETWSAFAEAEAFPEPITARRLGTDEDPT